MNNHNSFSLTVPEDALASRFPMLCSMMDPKVPAFVRDLLAALKACGHEQNKPILAEGERSVIEFESVHSAGVYVGIGVASPHTGGAIDRAIYDLWFYDNEAAIDAIAALSPSDFTPFFPNNVERYPSTDSAMLGVLAHLHKHYPDIQASFVTEVASSWPNVKLCMTDMFILMR